jgi:Domain of unknown function (DUF5605)
LYPELECETHYRMAQRLGQADRQRQTRIRGRHQPCFGNITPQELVHRFWVTVTRGGYAGHGECYAHPQDLLWWAKRDVFHGESWKRVAFFWSIIEEDVVNGLTHAPDEWPWQRDSMASDGEVRLICLGEHQTGLWIAGLPTDDRPYEVDLIDAWNMTVTTAKRVPRPACPKLPQRGGALRDPQPPASFAVELPSKPYQAIRIQPSRNRAA